MLTGDALSTIKSHLSKLNWRLLWHLFGSLEIHVIQQLFGCLQIVAALAGPADPASGYASTGHLLRDGHDIEGDTVLLRALLILHRVQLLLPLVFLHELAFRGCTVVLGLLFGACE